MAFTLIPGPTPTYLFRQNDVMLTTSVTGGSVAINLDTADVYDFDGSAWVRRSTYARDLDPALQTGMSQTQVLILRELRLMRRGMIAASTCNEYDGPPEELDEPS